ncbi:MAG: hypothetical protein A2017_14965 [Lentisphaerae bacterium GWF2_44_16]|nr:MAG: hypothetical protein A2017_14965 [Lentisphaerae bacterium GWF2_44_16]
MNVNFATISDSQPGVIAALLRASYAELLRSDSRWENEEDKFEEYDREVFAYPDTVGACVFLTRIGGKLAGFGSWDPRRKPEYAIIGHNCVLPEFRGRGLGKEQIREVLRRFQKLPAGAARVSTCNHPFFVPAQRMYLACGFSERRRLPASNSPNGVELIEYEKAPPVCIVS